MILIFCALSFFLGVAIGAMSYRNNVAKLQNVEAKAKTLVDEIKGK
jgi:hypothetical protein